MGHDEDGPLRPTYNHERPLWIGLYSKREYTKQPEWWAEPGLKDSTLRAKLMPNTHSTFREEDPDFYDPKVPDGKSLCGPMGLDSTKHRNITLKADQAGNLFDFQQKVMKGSLQYKQIAEKYNLSPEHPGLSVNPTMDSHYHTRVSQLGYGVLLPNAWQKYGPRFFDKPLNEGCFEKAAAAVKYAAIFMIPYTMAEIRATQSIKVKDFSAGQYFKRYLKLSPFPVGLAATWAISICTVATIRNKDDVSNHFYTGPITGAFVASVKNNIFWGVATAGMVTLGGIIWQYIRLSKLGIQGRSPTGDVSGFHGGPHHWKMLTLGSWKTPESNF